MNTCDHEQPCYQPECQPGRCKHGETSCVCSLCDLETIQKLAPIDMEDWVPEMGWEMEDYE